MNVKRFAPLLFLVAAGLLLSGCIDFVILNTSELNARVQVKTPDGGTSTRYIRPGGSASDFSEHGGSFTVTTLPDEEYRALLKQLRDDLSFRLFDEFLTLSVEETSTLVTRLNEVDVALEELSKQGASCSGSAPDFSTVSVTIGWDSSANNWVVNCAVSSSEE